MTTWGEASLILHQYSRVFKHQFSLQRKGVIQCLGDVTQGIQMAEWEQWVDAHSPNACVALPLPCNLYKSVFYALNRRDIVSNLRSLLWGCGAKRYRDQWWRPILLRIFHRLILHRGVGFKTMMCWYQEGRQVPTE